MGFQPVSVPYTYQANRSQRYRIWPMRAVRDTKQPQARDTDEIYRLENCYPQDTEIGPLIVGRPGFWMMGTTGSGAGLALGTAPNQRTQLIFQLTKRSGTEVSLVIVGGQMYTYNWSSNVLTESVTAANLATASVTLSATAKCYAVAYADTVVISDGVNKPFTWDGSAGAGGLTPLTNAAVAYGQPVVRAAKLFFIKNAARGTFIWSEEAAANTGYEAGGYNNAWDFAQTATEGLVALAGTNDGLYVFRQNSSTAVLGDVTTDFKTSSTKEALDSGIGTLGQVIVVGTAVWFVDQYGILRTAEIGQGVQEIGSGAREFLKTIQTSDLDDVQMVDDVETNHVRIAFRQPGITELDTLVWVQRDTGRYVGRETGYQLSRLGILKDSDGTPTLIHGGGTSYTTAADGFLYAHGHVDANHWADGLRTYVGTANSGLPKPIEHVVEGPFTGYDTYVEKLWVRGELSTTLPTALTNVQVSLITPSGTTTPLVLEDITGVGTVLGVFLLSTDMLGSETSGERKVSWGMRVRARWARLRVTHTGEASERLAIGELNLEAVTVSKRPGIV